MNLPDQSKPVTIDDLIIIGFLYGIQSDLLSKDEVEHRVAGFKHTKGFKESKLAINKIVNEAKIEAFDIAFDSHDYDRLRKYRANLIAHQYGLGE